jgi:hypothetical protein
MSCLLAWTESRLAFAEKRWADAWTAFECAHQIVAQCGACWYEAQILTEWADALAAHGAPDNLQQARNRYRQALALYEQMNIPLGIEKINQKLIALEQRKVK